MNSYDDIKLEVVKTLNTTILNNAFKKLYDNDTQIVPAHDYTPSIWENKWFNDEVIPGYQKGQCVWRNVYADIGQFLSSYGDLVYKYCQGNELLENYILSSWTDISCELHDKPASIEAWKQKYFNAISGYSKEVSSWYETVGGRLVKHSIMQQLLPPIFDYGQYAASDPLPAVEVYVSTADDNKELLSNSTAWMPVTLSSQDEYGKFISAEIDAIFDQHIAEYHLGGQLTKSEISTVLLASNLSNFDYSEVQNPVQVHEHGAFMNTDGFDYVIDYKRYAVSSLNALDAAHPFWTYRWYRLWSSGFLEHGGTVKCNPIAGSAAASNPDNYIVKVDFTWNGYNDIIYNYDETSGNSYGVAYERLYYGDKRGSATSPVREIISEDEKFLNGMHYSVSLTPIVIDREDFAGWKYQPVSALTGYSYPEQPLENKNQPYLVTEVHHLKNSSFCFTRSDTDTLAADRVQYYSYYVTGYRKIVMPDYNFASARVTGLLPEYPWTGLPVVPAVVVTNNLSAVLEEGRDYRKVCKDNIDAGSTATMQLIGIRPYVGVQDFKFKITGSV